MSEAEAFAAGYAAAIKVLKLAKEREEEWSGCGVGLLASKYSALAINELERSIKDVGSWFETWQLSQDPAFRESLEQMKRGEGRVVRRVPRAQVDPNHWSYWTEK